MRLSQFFEIRYVEKGGASKHCLSFFPHSRGREPIPYSIDIHDYVTRSLMPKLEWGRITEDRLNRLNEILKGVEMELETSDTSEAALYRNFLPVGFKTWDEYLDSIILPVACLRRFC